MKLILYHSTTKLALLVCALIGTAIGISPVANAAQSNGPAPYHQIKGVVPEINNLGQALAQAQRDEVFTGGNEYSGCYTDAAASEFHESHKLKKIIQRLMATRSFALGVSALKKVSSTRLTEILERWNLPIDKTWAANGHIGSDGTTEAGKQIETEMATALTTAVKRAVVGK